MTKHFQLIAGDLGVANGNQDFVDALFPVVRVESWDPGDEVGFPPLLTSRFS